MVQSVLIGGLSLRWALGPATAIDRGDHVRADAHMAVAYMLLMDFDTGPGTGLPTAVGLLLAAGGIIVFTFLPPQPADFRTLLPEPARL